MRVISLKASMSSSLVSLAIMVFLSVKQKIVV
jgi:hypothetical protein